MLTSDAIERIANLTKGEIDEIYGDLVAGMGKKGLKSPNCKLQRHCPNCDEDDYFVVNGAAMILNSKNE